MTIFIEATINVSEQIKKAKARRFTDGKNHDHWFGAVCVVAWLSADAMPSA